MMGFIIKDILANKKYLYITCGVTFFYIIYGSMMDDFNFFFSFLMIFGVMFILSTFSYDDMAGWDMYALTMPALKSKIIMAKYMLSLIFILFSGALVLALNVLASFIKDTSITKETMITLWIYICIALLFNSIQIPLIIKFGAEKGRFIILAIFFTFTLSIMAMEKYSQMQTIKNIFSNFETHSDTLLILSPLFMFLILLISIKFSTHIYSNKEY